MKRLFTALIFCALTVTMSAATDFTLYKGVYAADSAEAVITDSVCILYFQKDGKMQAIIEVPGINLRHQTVFAPDGEVSFPAAVEPLAIKRHGDGLNINGFDLEKVENVTTVPAYEPDKCTSAAEVGKCLQQWRLGADYAVFDNLPSCEINTNRHMFVYMVQPNMVYIRAAAARNNDHGTLFFQNIRMMKNLNTDEYTMFIMPDNLAFARADLAIDNSKFQPNSCTYEPDGGIYWSLISYEPDKIFINGCGETYQVVRPEKADDFVEWIKYEPYSAVGELPLSQIDR